MIAGWGRVEGRVSRMPELIPLALIILYLIPFLFAAARNHDLLVPILIANVFLGWTILGWFALLVVAGMSSTGDAARTRRS